MAEFALKPFAVVVVQVYAPTSDFDEEAIEAFYADLNSALQKCKKHEIVIVMGDLNANVSSSKTSRTIGQYGLGGKTHGEEGLLLGVKATASKFQTLGSRSQNEDYTLDSAQEIGHETKLTTFVSMIASKTQ